LPVTILQKHRGPPLPNFDFPLLPNPFRPLPHRAPKSRRINTYGNSRKCCVQRTYSILSPLDSALTQKQGVGVLLLTRKSKRNFYPACPEPRRERPSGDEGSLAASSALPMFRAAREAVAPMGTQPGDRPRSQSLLHLHQSRVTSDQSRVTGHGPRNTSSWFA
jgi:hypothetical protein